jgi:CRP-like cAMP-binding protein
MCNELRKLTKFDNDTWKLFCNSFIQSDLNKGDFILQHHQVCKHIFFVEQGLLRSYQVEDGEERSIAFAQEGSFVTDLRSLRTEQPGELMIQALEPSKTLCISKRRLIELYQQSHQIEAFGRNLLETLLQEQQELSTWFRLHSAKDRYNLFIQKYPLLSQRLSLGHLASYLGVRRETLSRIRNHK